MVFKFNGEVIECTPRTAYYIMLIAYLANEKPLGSECEFSVKGKELYKAINDEFKRRCDINE